jgi:hypothetical protein
LPAPGESRTITNDQVEFVLSLQKCEDNWLPQFTTEFANDTNYTDFGFEIFNDIALFAKNIQYIDPYKPLPTVWLETIDQIDKEYSE